MKTTGHSACAQALRTFVLLLLCSGWTIAQDAPPDFSISESFLKKFYTAKTIQPIMRIHLDERSATVHTIDKDCEIHIAGTPEQKFGDPSPVVIEPPNLCKFDPPSGTWLSLLDEKVMDKTCEVKGFLRIFTEHAQSGNTGANPNHVFEIHPALSLVRGDDTLLFVSYLTVFDKMAAIKPATTVSCLDNRRLDVRYNGKRRRYEFREQGGRCGNFAIVEVTSTDKDWVTRIEGGHSAMVRVTPDGLGLRTLKLYTLTGSTVDTWLDSVMQGQEFSQRKLIHGLFTYDFFAIIQTVRTGQGQWLRPKAWTQVQSPLAFVVYGETQTIPWEEE